METDQRKSEVLCDLQRNGLKILQSPEHFCFGIDAVLLSAYAAEHIQSGSRVLDLGTGTGIIPILLSARTKAAQLTGLEIQAECAEMARRSVQLNNLGDRVEIVTGDLKDVPSLYAKGSFDVVTCNPPFMPAGAGLKNPAGPLAIARHEVLCSFGDIAAAAAHVLKPGGHLCLVHRPFRLPELFETLKDHRLEPKEMQLVSPYADREPNLVLLDCVHQGRPGLRVDRPLIVYDAPGRYTQMTMEIYYGAQQPDRPCTPGRKGRFMTGTLYLCATPIGNLGDITLRVLDTLREADLIAAEDTRNTRKLLNHFEIKKPLTSYHEHNKYEKADELIGKLRSGVNIALVTDAGTPAISDPGEVLAARCIEEGIPVTSLPGACALITALTLSGKSARRFCFEGFLPTDKKERRKILDVLAREERTIILYEAPHRLKATLEELREALGDRPVTLCRELTKKFEEAVPTTLGEAPALYADREPRGEYVLVLAGADPAQLREKEEVRWRERPLEEHMAYYEDQGIPRKEAMKKVAADRGITRREVYAALVQASEE